MFGRQVGASAARLILSQSGRFEPVRSFFRTSNWLRSPLSDSSLFESPPTFRSSFEVRTSFEPRFASRSFHGLSPCRAWFRPISSVTSRPLRITSEIAPSHVPCSPLRASPRPRFEVCLELVLCLIVGYIAPVTMLYLSFPFLVLNFVKPRPQYSRLAFHRTSSTFRTSSKLRTDFEDFKPASNCF